MSFHESATDVRLEKGHMLVATLTKGDGETVEASLDLNERIGNDNGSFAWAGENFRESADEGAEDADEEEKEEKSIKLNPEGDEQLPILRAYLRNVDGEGVPSDLNLAEHIGNDDGELVWVGL